MIREENPFYLEIMSQPDALFNSLEEFKKDNFREIRKIHDSFRALEYNIEMFTESNIGIIKRDVRKNIRKILFIGMGTSYFASLVASHFFNCPGNYDKFNINCESIDASELLYNSYLSNTDSDTLIILISQSGESGELIQLLKKLKNRKFPEKNIWSITNTMNSSLANETNVSININAGEEKTVTNKTYLCTILALNILIESISLSRLSQLDNVTLQGLKKIYQKIEKQIKLAISEMKSYLDQWETNSKNLMDFIGVNTSSSSKNNIVPTFLNYLSRGTSLSTAGQAALNTKEVCRTYAESISLGMFRHGCIEVINSEYRGIIISNSPIDRDSANDLMKNITTKWGNGKIILITNSDKQAEIFESNENVYVILHNVKNIYFSPIFEIIPIQVLFYSIAELKEIKPGCFIYSQKITTDF